MNQSVFAKILITLSVVVILGVTGLWVFIRGENGTQPSKLTTEQKASYANKRLGKFPSEMQLPGLGIIAGLW